MLTLFTSKWRQRAAAVLVALYALCVLAPATAFAFSDNSPARCLTMADHHQGMAQGGEHDDHDKSGLGHDQSLTGKCCGLFCVTAVTPMFDLVAGLVMPASGITAPVVESLFGRSSNRIDRPPRQLSFV